LLFPGDIAKREREIAFFGERSERRDKMHIICGDAAESPEAG